jgi:hypothetical protein
MEAGDEEAHIVSLGATVEDCFLAHVQLAMEDKIFSAGEIVTVREDGADGPAQFIYAMVLPLLEDDRVGTSFMRRHYRLQVGPCDGERMVSFVDIFELTRVPNAATGPTPEVKLQNKSPAGGSTDGAMVDMDSSMHAVANQLREMEELELDELKSAFRRLCAQYQPDMSGVGNGKLFHLIKRHGACFTLWKETGMNFSEADWCYGVAAKHTLNTDSIDHGEDDCDPSCTASEEKPSSFQAWAHGVVIENNDFQSCIRSQQRSKACAFVAQSSGCVQRRDEEESTIWLKQALVDKAMAVYAVGGGFHAHAVWACQQAAEKVMKVSDALMTTWSPCV